MIRKATRHASLCFYCHCEVPQEPRQASLCFYCHCEVPQEPRQAILCFYCHCDDPQGTAASHSLLLLSLRGSAGTAAIQSPAMYALDCFGGPPTAVSNVARGCYRAADAIVKEYGFMIILLVIKVPRKEDVMFATQK